MRLTTTIDGACATMMVSRKRVRKREVKDI